MGIVSKGSERTATLRGGMSARGESSSESEALLSVVIPAHNEEQNLETTISELESSLDEAAIPFEILIVNDNSTDGTQRVAEALAKERNEVRVIQRSLPRGFGWAVRRGLREFSGDMVVIVMADSSDDPQDVIRYYRELEKGYDCVFGSRFRKGCTVTKYPFGKLMVNRLANWFLQILFRTRFNDLTNAFKGYRRHVVAGCGPYSACHYNLTLELSLGALIRKYSISEIPISWYGRTWGGSKLSIYRMGRRYLSVVIKMFFDSVLVGDDIVEESLAATARAAKDRLAKMNESESSLGPGSRVLQSDDPQAPIPANG